MSGILSEEVGKIALAKLEMLATGLRLTPSAIEFSKTLKNPIRTRSGVSGGLDLILPFDIHVNAPVGESYAKESHLFLDYSADTGFVILRDSEHISSVELQSNPLYYDKKTKSGKSMKTIGQMCSGDRFCYGMTGPYCRYWRPELRCKYCSIGYNKGEDASQKQIDELLETLEEAINDPLIPAKHILLGGGTPNTDDMGASLASKYAKAIKRRFNISIYVMIAAPLRNEYIDEIFDSGADELGMNLEFWSPQAWEQYIPGKNKIIGKARYLEALEYAVKKFGPINTRTIFVAGLENERYTIDGAVHAASMGVMPIVSPFRPLEQTMLEENRGFDHHTYYRMYEELYEKVSVYNIPLGPTCVACQNNVLALPVGSPHYHHY